MKLIINKTELLLEADRLGVEERVKTGKPKSL
jgi:hypothetical protein